MSRGRTKFGDDSWGTKKTSGGDDMELDITPMIDVTFLLLIFFMVASTMQPAPNLNVPAAKYGLGVEKTDAMLFFVASDGTRGQLPVITDEKKTPYTLEELADRITTEIEAGKQKIIIQADRRTPVGFLADMQRTLKDYPEVQIYEAVREKKE